MTQDADEIYAIKDVPPPNQRPGPGLAATRSGALLGAPGSAPLRVAANPCDSLPHQNPSSLPLIQQDRDWKSIAASISTWTLVAFLLISGGVWAFHAGIDLRHNLWITSRSARFYGDIWNGFRWGDRAMREAEKVAGQPRLSDALADQTPAVLKHLNRAQRNLAADPKSRRLTLFEVFNGIVQFYDDRQAQAETQDLELDYPPLRLMTMTLWVRHVQRAHPEYSEWPWPRPAPDTPGASPEDLAQPLLNFNTACSGVAAIAMFFLVWIWTARSMRPSKSPCATTRYLRHFPLPWYSGGGLGWGFTNSRKDTAPTPPSPGVPGEGANAPNRASSFNNSIPPGKPTDCNPWALPRGMLAFLIATAGFWYAFVSLAGPPLRPSPAVQITRVDSAENSLTVFGFVNPELANGAVATYHVDWGADLTYGHKTRNQSAAGGHLDLPVTIKIPNVETGQTIHLRLAAKTENQISNSADVEVLAGNPSTIVDAPPVGGLAYSDWTVWLRLLALFIAMVVSARMLPAPHRGWALGAIAAALVWFDPANLVTSHAWPQWDVWILPVFVAAGLFATMDCWLIAGLTLGVGCMFKGQLLLGMPVLLLWPLFAGRFGAFFRVITGLSLGAAFVVWPWIIAPGAFRWIGRCLIAAGIVGAATLLRPLIARICRSIYSKFRDKRDWDSYEKDVIGILATVLPIALVAIPIAALLIFFHVSRSTDLPSITFKCLAFAILLLPWLLPRKALGYWLISIFSAAIWISSIQFNGDFSWMQVGFAYGTEKFPYMAMGNGDFSNFMAVMAVRYRWNLHDSFGSLHLAFNTPGPWHVGSYALPYFSYDNLFPLDVKTSVALIYAMTVIASAVAAAVHSRRNDPRILAALAAPWIIFPLLMGQMSERYLLWGSAASAAFVAISMGTTLLHVLLALLGAGFTAGQLLGFDPQRWPQLSFFISRVYPYSGWMVTLAAILCFAAALIPSSRKKRALRDPIFDVPIPESAN